MKASDFLESALSQLEHRPNPIDRLSAANKSIYEKNNYIIDVHCHLFDITTVNIKYFLLRMLKDFIGVKSMESVIDSTDDKINFLKVSEDTLHTHQLLTADFDTEASWQQLEDEIDYVNNQNIPINNNLHEGEFATKGFVDAFKARRLLKLKKIEDVYLYYKDEFALNKIQNLGFENKDLLITALMMDLETGWKVKTRKSFEKQMEEYLSLAENHPVLPFFACDPRRQNLYELFLKAFPKEGPTYFGVKIYPGLGYAPSDYRLEPIFEICEKMNIPVLTHCGGESVTTTTNKVTVFRGTTQYEIHCDTRQEVASILNDPKEWEPVLNKYPKLKLNLAHFGGDNAWKLYGQTNSSPKVEKAIELMTKFEGVYADFSYNLIETELESIYVNTLTHNNVVQNKSLYGTDFWVVIPGGDLNKRQSQILSKIAHKGILDKMVTKNTSTYLFEKI